MKTTQFQTSLFLGVVGCGLYLLQSARLLSVFGVEADFILIFFVLLVFFVGSSLAVGIPLACVIVFVFFVSSFWVREVVILAVLTSGLYFAKRFFTGNLFLDFSLSLFSLSIIFYVVLSLFFHTPLISFFVIEEALMNMFLGAVAWGVILFLKRT